mmetsp:Transcript_15028/g.34673  ORF Transcript_15028/g.34673 Transcript_15028/m.34673 type:complete len:109 (-) Transcript_15028:32-358(-)
MNIGKRPDILVATKQPIEKSALCGTRKEAKPSASNSVGVYSNGTKRWNTEAFFVRPCRHGDTTTTRVQSRVCIGNNDDHSTVTGFKLETAMCPCHEFRSSTTTQRTLN